MTDKEKFDLANDFDFFLAIENALDACDRLHPLQRISIKTIGDRIILIEKLEDKGFKIVKL